MSSPILATGSVVEGPNEVYFDAITGTRKRRSTPLKTSVEVGTETAAKTAPPPPPPPLPKFVPLPHDVENRRKCSGTTPPHVHLEIEANDLASFFVELQQFDAAGADEVKDLHDSGHANLRLASEKLKMKQSAYNELKNGLVVMAELRREIASVQALLHIAEGTLASPTCLEMPPGDLLKLELERKHLPSKIAQLEARALAEAASVRTLFAKTKLDPEQVLGHMRRGSGYAGDGRTLLDGHVHGLFTQGFIHLPASCITVPAS